MSQFSFTTIRRNLGKFALAAGFTSVMLAGGILVAAQDVMSPLPYGQKMASMGHNVVSTYAFASDDTCNAMLSVMNDSVDEPVFMTLTETTTNSLVASLALPATGAMFRLPQGAFQYKLTVQHVSTDDPTMYWMQVEKDCTTLDAQSGQPIVALVNGGGIQTVRVAVTDPNGQSFVLLPAGGAEQSSAATITGNGSSNGGNNGGGNNGGGNNGGGNNGGGNNGGGNNGGGNNGGGNNGGGNNGGGNNGALIEAGLTIIIRNELTGALEDVLTIDIDAGLAINLPEGNHLIDIVNNTIGDVGLGLTLDGDVSLTDIQVDVAAKLESNLINIDADVELSEDGLSLDVNGNATVGDTSLLDVNATVGGNGSTGSNGSLINVDATVGGNGSSTGSNGSLIDVDATVGGNGSTGSNGSLVDVNATVGGNGSTSNNSGSLVDVNANIGGTGSNAPIVDVNATVGGETAPIVDVNATVNTNNGAPVVDVNANVGGQTAPIVDVNANVNTSSAPAVDVNANVGGSSAPIVDVNASANTSTTSATVSVVNTPIVNVSTGSTGTSVNVGGIGVKLP